MATRSLTDLLKPVYLRAERFMVEMERRGVPIIVTCVYRSAEEQAALYAQGREKEVAAVNRLRAHAMLSPITVQENSAAVTKAKPGESYHQWRCAFDVVPLSAGKLAWDPRSALWAEIGAGAHVAGLEWGGDWRFRDLPHLQHTGGLSVEQLRAGLQPIN